MSKSDEFFVSTSIFNQLLSCEDKRFSPSRCTFWDPESMGTKILMEGRNRGEGDPANVRDMSATGATREGFTSVPVRSVAGRVLKDSGVSSDRLGAADAVADTGLRPVPG